MKLSKTDFYSKKEKIFLKKHGNLLDKYKAVLKKLENNPFDAALKTHKLKGELKAFHACRALLHKSDLCQDFPPQKKIWLISCFEGILK